MLSSKVPPFSEELHIAQQSFCPSTTVVNFLPSELSVVQQNPTFLPSELSVVQQNPTFSEQLLAAKLGSWYATAAVQVLDSQRTLGRDKILLQYECWIDREHRGGIKFYCSMSAGLTENTGEG